MGEITDWMTEQEFIQLLPTRRIVITEEDIKIDWDELLKSRIWLTAQRVRIPISEMSTSHIKNTLRCLKGESRTKIPHFWNGETHSHWIKLLEEELEIR